MELCLKGITKSHSIQLLYQTPVTSFSFDLRPTSFNFTQLSNIAQILETAPRDAKYTLLFANEKAFMVEKILTEQLSEYRRMVTAEFAGDTPIEELEKLNIAFNWHYHSREKIADILKLKNLKKIIFHHEDLQHLYTSGELYSFADLFKNFGHIEFELQVGWSEPINEALFELFNFTSIAHEVNFEVESSYQNIDAQLVMQHLSHLDKIFNQSSSLAS